MGKKLFFALTLGIAAIIMLTTIFFFLYNPAPTHNPNFTESKTELIIYNKDGFECFTTAAYLFQWNGNIFLDVPNAEYIRIDAKRGYYYKMRGQKIEHYKDNKKIIATECYSPVYPAKDTKRIFEVDEKTANFCQNPLIINIL